MKTVQNDLNSHGLSWTDAVDLAQNRVLVTTVQWCYALVVVQAGDDDDDDDDEDDDDVSSRSCRTAVIVLSQVIVRFTKPEPETWVLCFKLETQV